MYIKIDVQTILNLLGGIPNLHSLYLYEAILDDQTQRAQLQDTISPNLRNLAIEFFNT